MTETLEVMQRRNVFGVLSGDSDRVVAWMTAAPDRFFPGIGFRLRAGSPSPETLRALHAAGRLAVLAEVTNQYAGIAPDDSRMEPYWALAEELDIPVGIHIGPGPPGVMYLGAPEYRARLHSALKLEDVLVRHPRMRVYIMHAGFPLLNDLLAVLYTPYSGFRGRGGHRFFGAARRVLPVPPGHRGKRIRTSGDVRVRSNGMARRDRAFNCGNRRGAVLERAATAGHPLQQCGAFPASER